MEARLTKSAWDRTKLWLNNFYRRDGAVLEIAVFVDCDGVSPKDAERALKVARQYGHIRFLRIYGNHAGRAANAWARFVSQYNGDIRHLPTLTPGKNGNDIALSIDAIEVLFTYRIDVFVIVANDTDFVPLAGRLLQARKTVLGFGQRSTPPAFRSACTKFWDMKSLRPPPVKKTPRRKLWRLEPADAEPLVLAALSDAAENRGLVTLNVLSTSIKRSDPGFDPRLYSRRNIRSLLRDIPSIELVDVNGVTHARLRAADCLAEP